MTGGEGVQNTFNIDDVIYIDNSFIYLIETETIVYNSNG